MRKLLIAAGLVWTGWSCGCNAGAVEGEAMKFASNGVYAASAAYGIRTDGKCYELADGDTSRLARGNACWDAGSATIKLRGAKNQEVAAQILIPTAGKDYTFRVEKLEGIPVERVTFSVVAWSKTKSKDLVPDVVVPLDGSVCGIRSFDIPIDIKGLPRAGNRVGAALVEVWIPKDAAPGEKRGVLTVLREGREAARLGLSIEVMDFVLPDTPTYRLDLLSYSSPLGLFDMDSRMSDGGGEDFTTSDEAIAIEQAVYKLTLDNRAFLNILPYHSQRGSPRYAYPVTGQGADAKVVSFEGFDKRFGALLDGKTGKYGQPPAIFTLAFNINYPVGMRSSPEGQFDFTPFKSSIPEGPGRDPRLREYEETWRAVAEQYVDHFADKGWTQTGFEIYFNQKPNRDRNRTPWKLDEPTDAADYRGLHYLQSVAKWAFRNASKKKITVLTRLDIGHWECDRMLTPAGKGTRCWKAKQFNTGNAALWLKPVTDRWVVGVTHSEGAQHLISQYNTDEVMFDQYGTSGYDTNSLAVHSGAFSGLAWKHAAMGIEGRVFYKTSPGTGDPEGTTDHFVLYNGKGLGFKGVLASRRLKLWRDSVNDYEYLAMARKKNRQATEKLLSQMVRMGPATDREYRGKSDSRGFWFTNNVEDVARARMILNDIIKGTKSDTKLEGWGKEYAPCGEVDMITGYD
ncbi:MAG: hypothetical protein JW909_13395 [Planctomycetes bacterium]|nr:hypothetical protein [Planctomycetota bacterium]